MLILYFILAILTFTVMALDASKIGLFGKAIKNYRIAGIVNRTESRHISFLCARALNHEIPVNIFEKEDKKYLVFKHELVALDISNRWHWTFGNRMCMYTPEQEDFNNTKKSENLLVNTKEDIDNVIEYCKNNDLITVYKQKKSIQLSGIDHYWWLE